MSPRLLNKVAIITGSSSGLGRSIALHFSREGARVVCADLKPGARAGVPEETEVDTDELIRRGGGEAMFVKTDVGDAGEMRGLVERAVGWEGGGRVDVMVNNAGVSLEARNPASCHETTEEIFDSTMRINAKSVFLGCKYATAQMVKQEPHSSGDRGWIINMSSIFGLVAGPIAPAYAASKHAVVGLTKQVALDYAKHKIHVNALCPGYTQTAIFADTIKNMESMDALKERHPLKELGMPDDIAKMAVVLASEDASWMTGAAIPVDGGYTAR